MIISWLKSLFKKKEGFYPTPSMYGSIEYNEYAKRRGMMEDATKEFKIIENNRTIKVFRYSESLVESYQEKYDLPVIDMTGMEEEELPIYSIDRPGVIEE